MGLLEPVLTLILVLGVGVLLLRRYRSGRRR